MRTETTLARCPGRILSRGFSALILAAVVTSCSSGTDQDAKVQPTVIVTITEEATASVPAPASTDQKQPQPVEPEATSEGAVPTLQNCGVDPQSPEITAHTAEVPAPSLSGMSWIYHGDSNYDPCATLSYATVVQSSVGDGQFQNQLMLFHYGKYLGIGSDSVQQHSVITTDDTSVKVRYKDYDALEASGEPFAAASKYTTEVVYRWVSDHVELEGRIPNIGR